MVLRQQAALYAAACHRHNVYRRLSMRGICPSKLLRAAYSTATAPPNWSHTLHLPKSSFSPAPSAAELLEYRKRCSDDLYQWQRANRPAVGKDGQTAGDFVLHDGPPYANGSVHVGHAINKILKDLILRTELSQGKRVKYQPGWDCHGLPIELKALQQPKQSKRAAKSTSNEPDKEAAAAQKRSLSPSEIRDAARALASAAVDEQRKEFREWGVMGEWDKPYQTMDHDFEITQLEIFKQMVENGRSPAAEDGSSSSRNQLIYRANMPVYWSPSSRSALAESELEYDDNHKCTAAYVTMQIDGGIPCSKDYQNTPVSALIWTTTPWTLPANRAIAINPDIYYGIYELGEYHETMWNPPYLIADDRFDAVDDMCPYDGYTLHAKETGIKGSDLIAAGLTYQNIFNGQRGRVVGWKGVTATSGTGLVHMAPGHGSDDYLVCESEGIETTFAPVDDRGCYTADVAPNMLNPHLLPGLPVETKGAEKILEILQDPWRYLSSIGDIQRPLYASHEYVHKNPIDWRTKKPVIVRSTPQWFASVGKIAKRAVDALDDVTFIPEAGRNRLRAFLLGRQQWCISRQRSWGVPIPVLYNKHTDKEDFSSEVVAHLINVIRERGTDAWFKDALDDPAYIPASYDKEVWVRKLDTMDVWFDSGTSWKLMEPVDGDRVADVYLEGSDQHRGWFQSSLLTKIATTADAARPTAPYKKLITHGFTLDGNGKKMSKSLGNVISPSEIISGALAGASKGKQKGSLGPDLLRLWVASCDYTKDITVAQQGVQTVQQTLSKLRITFRYLLGVLKDYEPRSIETTQPLMQDRMILHQLSKQSRLIHDAHTSYKFSDAVKSLNHFIFTDLSAVYFEAIKDTLYTGLVVDRKQTQSVLYNIMNELLQWLAPITPHLVEEVWELLPSQLKQGEPPLQRTWLQPYQADVSASEIEPSIALFQSVSSAVKAAQEQARTDGKVGSGLACHVELHFEDETALQISGWSPEELRQALVVSTLAVRGVDAASASSAEADDWRYEHAFAFGDPEIPSGKAVILPALKEKCPRCWQYTAESKDNLCGRCEKAVEENDTRSD